MKRTFLVGLFFLVGLVGCGTAEDKGTPVAPPFVDGKADVGERVVLRGALAFGDTAAVTGSFAEDLEFHGYTLAVRAGATVTFDVTRTGSSRKLDTTLYVYGPRTAAGGYGTTAVAFDDDAGWSRLSRLTRLALPAAGEYLVVVGTQDGLGRGTYRLATTCLSGECGPLPVTPTNGCHPAIADAIRACADEQAADPDYDPYTTSRVDLLERCADAEPVAPAYDALCAGADAPADLCALSYEDFATTHLPLCFRALYDELLDGSCVFGERYGDLFDHQDAVVIVWRRELTAESTLTDLEKQQIVAAVRATAYDDVTTVEAAFEAVDEGLVHQHELWDASGRRAFTAYEVGAGDNSFGMYFRHGTTESVARINDGDIYDCTVTWGPERRVCATNDDCAEGLRCTGVPEVLPRGRCIATAGDDHPAIGSECVGVDGCPAGAGLVCAGAIMNGQGFCLPGWMRGRFVTTPQLAIPDNAPAGATAQLLVYGLATVDMDVVIDVYVTHPRVADLTLTLVNPLGTEIVVYDGAGQSGTEVYLRDVPVRGFPGDESVNGVWSLRAVDRRSGQVGTIQELALTITSRWD